MFTKFFIVFFLFVNQIKLYSLDFNLFIGTNYIAQTTIDRFESICKCKLNLNYFNDNSELIAKIIAGASGYDIIVATSFAVSNLISMHKILPLDKNRILNLQNINPSFLNQEYDPNNRYSIPYAFDPVVLAYNKEELQKLKLPTNTWALVFDPKYLSKISGRVTMLNSAQHVFSAALLYLGKNPNSFKEEDIYAARSVIERASKYWARYDSDNYYRDLLKGYILVSQSYSVDIFKVISDATDSKSKIKIDASVQKEGNMMELDNLVIFNTSKELDADYQFINNSLLVQSNYELAKFTGASIIEEEAKAKLDKKIRDLEWIYPKNISKFHSLSAYPTKIRNLINEMWTEILMHCHK